MKIDVSYFDENAEQLCEKYDSITAVQAHPTWIDKVAVKGKRVLDVGAGSGRDAMYLANKGAIVTAIDQSNKLLSFAKLKDPENKVKWVNSSLPMLDGFKGKDFDLIYASAVLMFLDEKEQIMGLERLLTMLSQNGILIFSYKQDPLDSGIFEISSDLFKLFPSSQYKYTVFDGGEDGLKRSQVSWSVVYVVKL